MGQIICAIDQGTTATKVILLDDELNILGLAQSEFDQIYPEPSWVEHDPDAIWETTVSTLKKTINEANVNPNDIAGIGITNQRETTVVWDRRTGEPIHNAIVWQDRRTSDRIAELKAQDLENHIHQKTGLLLDPYFSATKLEWILDHVDGARKRAQSGELAFGTIDSYLLWKLTGDNVHATDVSNASRTMLMDLEDGEWDADLLERFNVPASLLPDIAGNSEVYGHVRGVPPLKDGTPICGMAGDQQAALFGQTCFESGTAKCTYGTGAFLLMNTGESPYRSDNRLLATAAWELEENMTYALEGSAFTAGALIQWIRDELGLVDALSEVEPLARSVDSSEEVIVVPSHSGLGAPHWKPDVKGVITGLTRNSSDAHIVRAALEGIALMNVDIFKAMEEDADKEISDVKVDGGATINDLLMQLQADYLDANITRPEITETTSLGAALLAGLALDVFSDLDEIRQAYRIDETFHPSISEGERQETINDWDQAIEKLL